MLFATLDPTTRKLNLPRVIRDKSVASLSGHSVSSSTESRSVLVVEEDGSSIYELDDESVINSSTTSNDILSTSTSTSTTETSTALVAPNIASQSAIPPEPIQFETYADCEVSKGQEIFLTDTVGFISKLPTDLIAAFRATLEEVREADVLIHVCDRSSPVWRKQRRTVLKELAAIGCTNIPIVELWNKIDMMPNSVEVMLEASRVPVDVEGVFGTKPISDDTAISTYVTTDSNFDESNNIKSNRIVSDSSTSTNTSPPKHKAPSFSESKRNQAYSGYSKDGKGGSSGRGAKRVPVEDNYFWSGEDDEYITQDAPITYSKSVPTSTSSTMTTTGNDDMESFSNQNQEESMSAISSTDTSGTGPLFTVAASVKSGLGFNNFLLTLEKALTLKQETVVLFVPYDKDDGTVTLVFSQATIESVEYKDTGTYIVCKISDSMLAKVNKFIVNDDIIFM